MEKRPTMDDIIAAGCEVYGVDKDFVNIDTMKTEVVWLRQALHYLARRLTKHTQEQVGKKMGNRDHATVRHSYEVVAWECQRYGDRKAFIEEIEKELNNRGFTTKPLVKDE